MPRTPVLRRRKFVGKNGVAGPGGGSTAYVPVPLEWRGTTRQICGLFPWSAPGQLPLEGVPLGRHQTSRSVICFDHVSWFLAKRIANPSVLIIAKPGLGKALDVDTPIPVPGGWTTMGELRGGDLVFDEQGRPTPIVAVSEVMVGRECVELEFSDGSTIVADGQHLWVTETVATRRNSSVRRWYAPRAVSRRVGNRRTVMRSLLPCLGLGA